MQSNVQGFRQLTKVGGAQAQRLQQHNYGRCAREISASRLQLRRAVGKKESRDDYRLYAGSQTFERDVIDKDFMDELNRVRTSCRAFHRNVTGALQEEARCMVQVPTATNKRGIITSIERINLMHKIGTLQ